MKTIGVDLGGTNMKAALVDETGQVLQEISAPTNLPRPAEAVCDDIAALCLALSQDQQVAGIGVGCPGTVDGGVVRYSNNLAWHDFDMAGYLRQKLDLPVYLGNDANVAALGEALAGCAKGAESAVFGHQVFARYVDRGPKLPGPHKLLYGGFLHAQHLGQAVGSVKGHGNFSFHKKCHCSF